MRSLGQVTTPPILAGYTALQSLIVTFEANTLVRALVRAASGVPNSTIIRAFEAVRAKTASAQPREMSEVEVYALVLGTLTQVRTDLVRAKMFMYSPASTNVAARAKFEQILLTDAQALHQAGSVLAQLMSEGAMPTLARAAGGGVSGLGYFDIGINMLRIAWTAMRTWHAVQARRELFLREQVALCEELSRRGTPCAPERVAELQAELQQMTDTPAARFLDAVGEGIKNVTSPFDNVGRGIGTGLKIGITTLSVGLGVVVLWWAWPLLTSTRRKPRTAE